MLAGGLTVIALLASQGLLANSPIYVGLMVSLIVFVVSLLTPRTSRDTMSAWGHRMSGTLSPEEKRIDRKYVSLGVSLGSRRRVYWN